MSAVPLGVKIPGGEGSLLASRGAYQQLAVAGREEQRSRERLLFFSLSIPVYFMFIKFTGGDAGQWDHAGFRRAFARCMLCTLRCVPTTKAEPPSVTLW